MNIEQLLHNSATVTTILINSLVLVFSFAGYRRTQMKAFAFLIAGSVIGLVLIAASNFGKPQPSLYPDEYRNFMEFYYFASIASIVMSGIGILLLIRYAQKKFEQKTPNNTTPDSK
jgi:hypothetical protein